HADGQRVVKRQAIAHRNIKSILWCRIGRVPTEGMEVVGVGEQNDWINALDKDHPSTCSVGRFPRWDVSAERGDDVGTPPPFSQERPPNTNVYFAKLASPIAGKVGAAEELMIVLTAICRAGDEFGFV